MDELYRVLQFIAVSLSILYTIWTLYHDPKMRENAKKIWRRVHPHKAGGDSTPSPSRPFTILPLPFHFRREALNIVLGGLLLNFLGYAVSFSLNKSVLYLDMTGTALVAFLLGPWWGAITGLLSNALVNYLLYPGPHPEFAIFPWSLVNMAGGLFWGWLGGSKSFHKYLRSPHVGPLGQIWYLFIFGVVGAALMSIPGAIIQSVLPETQPGFGETTELIGAINSFLITGQDFLRSLAETGIVGRLGESLAYGIHLWLKTWYRYVPDKTMSVAIAVMALRYGFPVYEQVLVHTEGADRLRDNWTGPTILGILYMPCFLIFLFNPVYHFERFWLLWICPLFFIVGGGVALWRWGPAAAEVNEALAKRVSKYGLLTRLEGQPFYAFYKRLIVGTMTASLFFVVGLLFLKVDFLRFAFNFQSLVLGFLLALHLVRLAICQNLALLIPTLEHPERSSPQEVAELEKAGTEEKKP